VQRNRVSDLIAYSNDLYTELEFPYLVSELERTRLEKKKFQEKLGKVKDQRNAVYLKELFEKQIDKFEQKEKDITAIIEELAQKVEVDKIKLEDKIRALKTNNDFLYEHKRNLRMKS
jgi:uncharacterized protein involved in exopolysaccharide biosynthesis